MALSKTDIGLGLLLLYAFSKGKGGGAPGPNGSTTYTVVSGDSLSAIAAKFWGDAFKSYAGAQVIADANPQHFGNGQDIDVIQVGWQLAIPPKPATPPVDGAGGSVAPFTSSTPTADAPSSSVADNYSNGDGTTTTEGGSLSDTP